MRCALTIEVAPWTAWSSPSSGTSLTFGTAPAGAGSAAVTAAPGTELSVSAISMPSALKTFS